MDCPLELPAAELPMLELPSQLNPEAPAPFNCMTRELWSDEKTAWCCDNEKLGCPVAEAAPLAAPVKTPAPQGFGHKIKNFFNNLFCALASAKTQERPHDIVLGLGDP